MPVRGVESVPFEVVLENWTPVAVLNVESVGDQISPSCQTCQNSEETDKVRLLVTSDGLLSFHPRFGVANRTIENLGTERRFETFLRSASSRGIQRRDRRRRGRGCGLVVAGGSTGSEERGKRTSRRRGRVERVG